MIYLGMEVIISSSELGEKFFIVTLYPLFYFMRCIFKQGGKEDEMKTKNFRKRSLDEDGEDSAVDEQRDIGDDQERRYYRLFGDYELKIWLLYSPFLLTFRRFKIDFRGDQVPSETKGQKTRNPSDPYKISVW